MERLEAADAAVAEQEALIADTNAQGAQLSAEAKTTVSDATTRLDGARRDRDAVAASVPADLLGLYERLASRGNGAGLLRAGACEACRMVLPPSDLATVRRAQTDEVVFCPSAARSSSAPKNRDDPSRRPCRLTRSSSGAPAPAASPSSRSTSTQPPPTSPPTGSPKPFPIVKSAERSGGCGPIRRACTPLCCRRGCVWPAPGICDWCTASCATPRAWSTITDSVPIGSGMPAAPRPRRATRSSTSAIPRPSCPTRSTTLSPSFDGSSPPSTRRRPPAPCACCAPPNRPAD